MKTIGQIFEFKVVPYNNNKAVPITCPDPTLLYGLELEIEGIQCDPTELYVGGMYGDADNSLRNSNGGRGWEFITKPSTFSIVNLSLSNFFGKAKFTEKNYSERCSVHVHCNVQDMTPIQLQTLCLLYQAFEGVLYQFAGGDRDKNIFCVPWAQTQITYQLLSTLEQGNVPSLRTWQKYTGLNLIPVTTQGTVEFRHLPGTCDKDRIMNWMAVIGCMFRTAKSMEFSAVEKLLLNVNTTSEYSNLMQVVFRGWEHLIESPNTAMLLEDGVINVKYLLHAKDKTTVKKTSYSMDALLARIQAEDFVRNEELRLEVEQPQVVRERPDQYRPAARNRARRVVFNEAVRINPVIEPIPAPAGERFVFDEAAPRQF